MISVQAYNQSRTFESHRLYFNQSTRFNQSIKQILPPIQPWMTVPNVAINYNLSKTQIYHLLKINNTITITQDKLTLSAICKKQHLNCTTITDTLNTWRAK